MHHHKPCPHCRSARDAVLNQWSREWDIRCRRCVCRWNLQGDLTFFSRRCPLMTGKKPRPEAARNAQGRNLTGREAALGSTPAQERLL